MNVRDPLDHLFVHFDASVLDVAIPLIAFTFISFTIVDHEAVAIHFTCH